MKFVEPTCEDEAAIRDLISKWSRAVEAKDPAAIVEDYLEEAVLYDAVPPYKVVGVQNIQQAWAGCLPYFPEKFLSEHRDLVIHVSGDLAIAHGLQHFTTQDGEHPCCATWMRATIVYRRVEGKWKVAHEHVSLPFNPLNDQTWKIPDPERLDVPDYSQSGAPCGQNG